MEISPNTIRSTGFKTVRKGYDTDEVEAFRNQVATAVEAAQNQAAAMEARARAAVSKLQEVSQHAATEARETPPPASPNDDAEVLSRTLVMAQRTADAAVAEARAEAEGITAHAREEAARVLDSARTMATKNIEDGRAEIRRAVSDERVKAENEVQALLARRDFLLADVDQLEQHLQAQRERLRDAAVQLHELVERVPGGLGDMRRPLLSASGGPERDGVLPVEVPQVDDADDAIAGNAAGNAEAPLAALDGELSVVAAPASAGPSNLTTMAMSSDAAAKDSVWRLLDEEVASTQSTQESLALGTDTAEVPRQAPHEHDPFRARGDELQ